ncbi:ESPR-type extended signal peptide-containing protein [Stenotrophomonas maltophilia]|uniref:ESPR-type extended signal peptide-containing protein n=1 Tax=Stenotrophomonas maltophilia TaxID=40324 RepID=UPI001FA76BE2|nr:ESPR-type extended signal peptide-containing protein [Stenotrophomonas maltophilia]
MNRIYRRIWSVAKQCWVVAGEVARVRGKRSANLSANVAVLSTLPVLLLFMGNVSADNFGSKCTINQYPDWISCLPYAGLDDKFTQASVGPNSARVLAMGNGAYVQGRESTVFGHQAKSVGDRSVAFGYGAQNKQGYSTAFGAHALTNGIGAVALGNGASSTYIDAISIGSGSAAGRSGYSGAIAVGGNSSADFNGVALGFKAKVSAANSVALGTDSEAHEQGTVSVGTSGNKRRIVNVADARLNATSTDAVTGKQLYATHVLAQSASNRINADSLSLGKGAVAGSDAYYGASTALGNNAKGYNGASVALGDDARAGVDAAGNKANGSSGGVSVGSGTRSAHGAVAMGHKAIAGGNFSVAIGTDAVANQELSTAFGKSSIAGAQQTTALGRGTQATAKFATAVGNLARATGISSLALGHSAHAGHEDAVAIGAGSVTASASSVSVGSASRKRKIQYVADGVVGSGSTDAITGNQLFQTNTRLSAVEKTAGDVTGELATVKSIAQAATNRIDATNVALGKGATAENASFGISTALGNNAKAYNGRSVALGDDARAGVDADGNKVANQNAGVSVGAGTRSANGAVATGFRANASGNFSIAVGGDAKAEAEHGTAVGYLSKASASQATSLGRGSEATAQFASALGNLAKATNTSSVALGDRAQASHENAVALGAGAVTASANSISVGSASRKRKIQYIADGAVGAGSTDAITGNQLHATNQAVTKAQTAADAATTTANEAKVESGKALAEAVALGGLVNQTAVNGNVRIGEKNSGTVLDVRNSANANRNLTGVADGVVGASSYDAVNGRQLNATNDKVTTVEGVARSAGEDAAVAKTDATKALAETAALGGLVAQVSASGDVRLGGKNSGTTLDVRNSANANRKISGVSDADLGETSTDAVSGRQLHATNESISKVQSSVEGAERRVEVVEETTRFLSIGSSSDRDAAKSGVLGIALGESSEASILSEGAVAIGAFSRAQGEASIAIGRASWVHSSASGGFALGTRSIVEETNGVAIGAGSSVTKGALNSVALGDSSVANESRTVSFGDGVLQRRLVNLANGTADHNATTVSQLKDSLATLGGGAGMDASGNIIAPTYAVQGGSQNTVEDALMALDGAVITAGRRADKVEGQLSSIFQDSPSARADGMNQIALNGVNGMVLTNLADGRVAPGSRDAVTGSQLYAAEQKISQNRNDLEAMRKEREMGAQAMRGLDASVIDYGGARLTGVAEATLSADSSDVVRGSQLYETNSRVSELEDVAQFVSIGSEPFSERAEAGVAGVAVGNSAKTGLEGGTAVGTFAEAMGKNSTAIGRAAAVSVDSANGFAMGVGAQVGGGAGGANEGIAIGAAARVEGGAHGSLALGNGSLADEEGVASFGGVGMKRRLVNIANGTANHNAATVGQLRGALSALGSEVDANGNIVGPSFNVQGQSQSTLNGALEALDGAVVSTTSRVNQVESQLRSVFQETPSVRADGTQQLTLAGANGMVISNVANGLIAAGSRDAVNGDQLHSMQQQLNGRMDGLEQRIDDQSQARAMAAASTPSPSTEEIAPTPETSGSPQIASTGEGDKPTPQPKSKQDDTPKPQVDTAELEKMLARANEYTDGAISNFERRLDKMDKRFNRMAAMSSAQSAMAMNTAGLATYNRLGAGVGYSEGESAMAVGYQRVLNEKGSATFSLNGAFTNSGGRSMGVGVGIGW